MIPQLCRYHPRYFLHAIIVIIRTKRPFGLQKNLRVIPEIFVVVCECSRHFDTFSFGINPGNNLSYLMQLDPMLYFVLVIWCITLPLLSIIDRESFVSYAPRTEKPVSPLTKTEPSTFPTFLRDCDAELLTM